MTKKTKNSSEKGIERIKGILEERGNKSLEMAREEILKENIECKEVREALDYFMNEYWQEQARPTILSVACEAVGGDPEATIPIAVPIILVSGATDIHDDIIDQSKRKYGKPTVYGKYGKDLALLVGDALLFKGLTLLSEFSKELLVPSEKMNNIVKVIKNTFFELGNAEASELRFRGRFNVTPEEYLRLIEKKAADVEACTRIGGILGGATVKEVEALGDYGRILGTILLIADDIKDLLHIDELKHRINNENLPLPLIYALQESRLKSQILPILQKKGLTKKTVQKISDMVYEEEETSMSQLIDRLIRRSYSATKGLANRKNLQLLVENVIIFPTTIKRKINRRVLSITKQKRYRRPTAK